MPQRPLLGAKATMFSLVDQATIPLTGGDQVLIPLNLQELLEATQSQTFKVVLIT